MCNLNVKYSETLCKFLNRGLCLKRGECSRHTDGKTKRQKDRKMEKLADGHEYSIVAVDKPQL